MKVRNGWHDAIADKPEENGYYLTYWFGDSGGFDMHYFQDGNWVQSPYHKPISHWKEGKIESPIVFE